MEKKPREGGFKRDATALVDAAFMGLLGWRDGRPVKPIGGNTGGDSTDPLGTVPVSEETNSSAEK